jgi:hypothetical protein
MHEFSVTPVCARRLWHALRDQACFEDLCKPFLKGTIMQRVLPGPSIGFEPTLGSPLVAA